MHLETKRKSVHFATGILFALAVLFLSVWMGFALLSVATVSTFVFAHFINKGKQVPLVYGLVKHTEREGKPVAYGVKWYFTGVLLTFVVFTLIAGAPKEFVVASMLIVAVGDGISTGLGRIIGTKRLPRTKTKSYEGSFIGFGSAFLVIIPVLSLVVVPLKYAVVVAFIGATVGMLAEAYIRAVNDNFTIPVLSCSAMLLAYSILLL
ncbi:MAG: hypothetical protein JW834_04395 [Candidatus Diapherotrites archaeon]|nr:hypothetical protein [Candidatus Diapherotrites archaeon]